VCKNGTLERKVRALNPLGRTKISSFDSALTAICPRVPCPPFLPFFHPPLEPASWRPRGHINLEPRSSALQQLLLKQPVNERLPPPVNEFRNNCGDCADEEGIPPEADHLEVVKVVGVDAF
jgi:hypothetical protein